MTGYNRSMTDQTQPALEDRGDDADVLRIDRPPRTLRELALERMRAAIIDLRFKPGERLVERTLCERLDVSRSVVREVLRHLETEGLVDTKSKQGPIVAILDRASAAEIYEIRTLLEAAAVAACAERADAAAVAALGEALDNIEAAFAKGDPRATLHASTRFYEVIFLSGGKHVAWEVVQRLNGRISRLRAMTTASTGRAVTGPARLRAIYEAIRARDPARAAAACREHLAEAAAIADRLLAELEAAAAGA